MRLLVVLDIEDGQATVIHSKPLVQDKDDVLKALDLDEGLELQ